MNGIDCVMVKSIGGRAVYISGDGFKERAKRIIQKRVAKGERLAYVIIDCGVLEIHTIKDDGSYKYGEVSKIQPGYQMVAHGTRQIGLWYKGNWTWKVA